MKDGELSEENRIVDSRERESGGEWNRGAVVLHVCERKFRNKVTGNREEGF